MIDAALSRLFDLIRRHPWWSLACLTAAHTALGMNTRALWFSDEVRYANAFENVVKAGKWLVLSLNGAPYPDKPPLYFWLLALLNTISDMPAVFFLGAAVSGLLFLYSTMVLGRALGLGRSTAAGACLVLLTTPFFVGLLHYSRMDLLFAALILAAQACLYRAFSDETDHELAYILAGFALCGLATLTKGPLGLVFPLLALAAWLAWRGELRRLLTRSVLFGFGLMLTLLAAWLGAALAVEGWGFVDNILFKQVVARAANTFHHKEPFYYYLVIFPPAFLPWTLAPLAGPLGRLFGASFWREAWTGRHAAGAAAYLWCCLLPALLLLSLLSGKVFVYILPLMAPLALLTADRILHTAAPLKGTWTTLAAFLALVALGLLLADGLLPLPFAARGIAMASLILGLAGFGLYRLRLESPETPLVFLALMLVLWVQPLNLVTAPSLDSYMSPKRQGEIIRTYAEEGYAPIAYDIYSGIFTYYAGRDLIEVDKMDRLKKELEQHPKAVLVMRKKHWDAWQDRPAGLIPVDERNLAGQIYVISAGNIRSDTH